MIYIITIFISLLMGIIIGITGMYYKNRNLLNNQKNLYNELQHNKTKLNEYQKKLSTHFSYNIEILNKISKNYQDLYQNITKNANFFLPNTYTQHDTYYTHHINNTQNNHTEPLPIETPKDYSDNPEHNILKKDNYK
ncbi:periplasmic membrane protein associated with membrane transport [Candidatus Blochmanniella floridana]|uniref:Z-ring associated protein G n=1 Tax=Blochmanniella floridana TaxID=203907 RepID=Q7VQR8_BLOFL|nr:periplasmic membrane protein associated with membrane transport [Candidatus Blochmannia floridanus]